MSTRKVLDFLKISGILLALVAVYLTASKPNSNTQLKRGLLLPFLLFIGSGTIDTSIKYIETSYVPNNGIPIFSASIFAMAFILGMLLIVFQKTTGKFSFNPKSILGGIILGVINYYSIYFLLKALQYQGLESSNLFTINNVAIVMTSTLIGIALFKERISKTNWIGIGLAIVSIVLVTLA